MDGSQRNYRGAGKGFVLFAAAYAVFAGVVAMLTQVGLPDTAAAILFLAVTLAAFITIALVARTMDLPSFLASARALPPGLNGMATAAAAIAGAGFLGRAGTFLSGESAGIAVIAGWALGFLALSILIAPFFRKSAAATVAEFLGIRYGSVEVRVVAVFVTLLASVILLIAELAAAGLVAGRLLDLSPVTGIAIASVMAIAASLFGGMQGVTLTGVAQYIVMAIAFVTPVAAISLQTYDIPLPHFTYGYALEDIAALGGDATAYSAGEFLPLGGLDGFNMLVLALSLAAGIASMPHIVMRSGAAASLGAARRSGGWALLFVLLLAAAAPAYAAFARLATVADSDVGPIDPGFLVLDFPVIAGLSSATTALLAIGALAALLAASSAALFSIAMTIGHDLYAGLIDRRSAAGRRLIVTRIAIVAVAAFAALEATRSTPKIFELAVSALSLAASGLFPAIVLGIWWKRATAWGALAGMLAGFVAAAAYVVAVVGGGMEPWRPLGSAGTGLPAMAAAFFGLPAGFLTIIFVSQLTREPTDEQADLVDAIRRPSPSPLLDANRN
jgi:cation/acetate symporter